MAISITMPRGDIHHIQFTIKDSGGEVVMTDFDEVYFTVKENVNRSAVLFQKKLSDGSIIKTDGVYTFTIRPEDTNSLSFKTYACDIEIILGDTIKTTIVGNLTLTPEVTYQENET